MKTTALRNDAVEILAVHRLGQLSEKQRDRILEERRDEGDPDDSSPVGDSPIGICDGGSLGHKRGEEEKGVLLEALRHELYGVTNSYLEDEIARAGYGPFEVIGEAEVLFECPCCRFRTLDRRGEYDICNVCFWEDNGCNDPERYCGPNHMTLAEGRTNFERLGVSEPGAEDFVDPNRMRRYSRMLGGR
jgi:hypothetical protein